MYSITVSVLPVGQGSMNLIEVYETEMFRRELVGLTMIDCGSARSRPCRNLPTGTPIIGFCLIIYGENFLEKIIVW